ncbi:MAG: BlaR1 peptidase [Segetibacter sp.]|nr:BlaR1 peptidase [Segetibacter sp.]
MLTIAWYLMKVMLCSGILYGYYLLALRNKKFHSYNRFYLLVSVALSWIIPLIKIDFWEQTIKEPKMVKLFAVVANGNRFVEETNQFTWDYNFAAILTCIFISATFFTKLLIAIVKIKNLIDINPPKKWNDVYFVFTNAKGTPFSFFKYIFWNEQIDLNSHDGQHILKHELSHVYERHSADKLFLNLVLIAGWYNPFIWLIRKELNMIHEFIADEKVIKEGDVSTFAAMLLKASYPKYSFTLANSFFYSPGKRRLLMLTSSKKTSFTYVRRVAILPLLMFTCVLFAFTIKKKKTNLHNTKSVIDYSIIKTGSRPVLNSEEPMPAETMYSVFQDTTIKKKRSNTMKANIEGGNGMTSANTTVGEHKVEMNVTLETADTEKLKKVLVVLDGKQMSWQQFEKKQLKPELITSMNVLKGEAAIKKYGEKGKDGVIEILSKLLNGENSLQQKKFEEQENLLKAEQNDEEKQAKYDKVFTIVENPPYYPDGMMAFAEYINKNVRYPKEALQNKIEGAVLIQFIVNEEGELTGFKKVSDKRYGLEEEAIRLLKNSGEWKPGIQNGHKVPVQIQQQIIFELPKKE